MKTNNLFKTAFLLLAMVGGVNMAWADDNPITIPGANLTSYIVIGNSGSVAAGITLSGNCKVDNNDASCYTIGSTKKDGSAVFALYNATSRDYYFSFYSGSKNVATQVKFVLSDGGSYSVEKTFDVTKTSAWTLTEYHCCLFENVPTGNLTLTMTFVSESTDYMGNYGNFCFNDAGQWPTLPLKVNEGEQTYVTTTATSVIAVYSGTITGGTEVSSIKNGGTAQYMLNNATAGRYLMHMGVKYYGAGTMTVTITDCATGTVEVNQVFDVPGKSNLEDYEFPFFADITAGVKIVKLVFNIDGSGYILNYGNIYFESYDVASRYAALPLKGTAVIDFSQSYAWFQGCKAETGNVLGSIRNGYYTDGYYFYNAHEEAYYDFCYNVTGYYNGGTIKLTVTDVASHTVEVNAEESNSITATGEGKFAITSALTRGLKRVRLEFVNTETDANNYLFNINNLSFSKTAVSKAISAGWATLYTDCALDFSETGLTVYTATCDGSTVTLTPVDDIPANTGVVLKGDLGTYTIPVITSSETAKGDLKGSATTATAYNAVSGFDLYMLALNDSNEAQFTKVTSGSIAAGKAYLQVAQGGGSARALNVVFADETTSISEQFTVNSEKFATAPVYNLNGQRVTQPTKGLYIVNGKKFIKN